ncbi:MAG: helical membrane plugin domain-containing protein [bacterium]
MAENEVVNVAAALTKKLTEKPQALEHLLNIIDRLDTIDQISAIPQALKESMTDSMIQRSADNITTALSVLDSFSGDEQLSMIKTTGMKAESLKKSIETIAELEKSGTLQSLKEMGDFVAGFSRGVTDSMVDRMAGTAEKLAELTELTLNYNLKPLLDTGESFINSGTLNDLVELSNGVAAARRMMTDGLMERAVGTGLELVEALLTQIDIKELINVIDCSTHETLTESTDPKYHKGGVLSLVAMTKDPDVMNGLKFMMILAKNLAKNLRENQQDIFMRSGHHGKSEC